jgi:Methyltransferase domain
MRAVRGAHDARTTPRSVLERIQTAQGRADARYRISRAANRALYPLGFLLLSDHFYQPVASREALLDHDQRFSAVLDSLDAQADRVESLADAHGGELAIELPAFGYGRDGDQLPQVDAALLYAMVRREQPSRVIEIGSGSSTTVIASALRRNAIDDGVKSNFISIDPFATPRLEAPLPEAVRFEHWPEPLQQVDRSLWATLGPSDILFVDSSHVFKPSSDVEYEFMHVYPALARGVAVHIHDIFFPEDYPVAWNLEDSRFWNEQHVLAAVLESSSRYEVVACLSALHRERPASLRRLVPTFDGSYSPGSLWLRVVE